jgi:cytoskeletal protein CcmA (bactofilin family)
MGVFKKVEEVRQSQPSYSPQREVEHSKSLIGKSVLIKGELQTDEELLVEGKIEGTVTAKNRVIIGRNGVVTADVEAKEIIIRGRINGNVTGTYKVIIEPDGVLNGNIVAQRVVLAEGAIFKGNIDMSVQDKGKSTPPQAKPAENKEAKEKKTQEKSG